MQFNKKALAAFGNFDTPWEQDYAALSAEVKQYSGAIDALQAGAVAMQGNIAALGSTVSQIQQHAIVEIVNGVAVSEYAFTPADYDFLLIGTKPKAAMQSIVCTSVPTGIAAGENVATIMVTNVESYSLFELSSTGITRTGGDGTIVYIYGVIARDTEAGNISPVAQIIDGVLVVA